MEDLLRILDRIEGDVEKWCAYQKIAYALVIKRLFAGVLVLFEQIDQSCRSQFIRELCAKLEDGSSVAFIEFIGFFKHELKAAAVDGLCEAMTSIANSGKIEIARRMISGFILDDERGSIIRTVVAGLVKEGSFYINPFIQCFTGRDRTYAVLGLYVA